MGLTYFLVLMVSAIMVTSLLMWIGEKVLSLTFRQKVSPIIKNAGSLVFAIAILSALFCALEKTSGMYMILLSGAIIGYNRYWFGHFSVE
ncbi:hypothetical protein [Sporosarcina gallistercoris]|uniref:ATP synthase subunit I n=1 Tax=Sporosarcina gallistercoris TaxID=2762245 RepID=A0ABR8PLK1_9BACL|nr:hypothetical protein [Sporosarcina gallistercoris]MBD7909062.1 hypothetical protein [Sporosarcina gallistercoris]